MRVVLKDLKQRTLLFTGASHPNRLRKAQTWLSGASAAICPVWYQATLG